MELTKEAVQSAGRELGDLIVLAIDNESNADQISQFAKEGFEAFTALAKIGIPVEHREAVVRNLVEGVLNRVNTNYNPLP